MTALKERVSNTDQQDQTTQRILVVDDENSISELIATSLKFVGFDVRTASSGAQALQIAQTAHNQGKNVVGVLISGRPLILGTSLGYFDSFVAAWLPGTEGGNGISDVLFGDFDFTGTLSFTWPKDLSQVGYTSNRSDYDELIVLYPFGYGLTYQD
mgnify:CR=1 FL=1